MYYLYQLINPKTNQPFYIGVGKQNRNASCTREQQHIKEAVAWSEGRKINKPNRLKFNTILKILKEDQVKIKTGPFFQNEQDAFTFEIDMIKKYGRRDLGTGVLTNLTDGGEGAVNMSKQTRQKLSATLKGRPSPLKGRKLGPYSAERRKAISEARKGYKMSEQQKEKLRGRTPWNKGMKFEYKERPNAKGRTTKNQWTKGHTPWNKGKTLGDSWAWNKGKTMPYKGKSWRLVAGKRVWYSK
jgi:hypothetical protein